MDEIIRNSCYNKVIFITRSFNYYERIVHNVLRISQTKNVRPQHFATKMS